MSPLHLPFDAALNVAVYLDLFHLDFDDLVDLLDSLREIHHFQQLLLFLDADRQVGADVIRQLGRFQRLHGVQDRVVIDVMAELRKLFEYGLQPLDQQACAGAGSGGFIQQFHVGDEKSGVVGIADRPDALNSFNENLDVAVGKLDALDNIGNGADRIDIRCLRFVDRSVHLCCQKNPLGSFQGEFQGAYGCRPPDHERDHHVGKNHNIPDRYHREAFSFFGGSFICHA